MRAIVVMMLPAAVVVRMSVMVITSPVGVTVGMAVSTVPMMMTTALLVVMAVAMALFQSVTIIEGTIDTGSSGGSGGRGGGMFAGVQTGSGH